MEKCTSKIIVYSLAGILLSGIGASVVQAAPGDRDNREPDRRQERRIDNNERDHQRNTVARRHVYNQEQYRTPHWSESGQNYEHRQPWAWASRNHAGRQRIMDGNWDREFPGLRSYRWHGPGFWYRGAEYQDLVMFYDDDDSLVSVGFWDRSQFIMIRDDDRSYFNSNPFVRRYRNSGVYLRIRL